ncbi:type II toxin-antitoxin system RelE/ParE family toxin [Alcanivorax sp. DG881]
MLAYRVGDKAFFVYGFAKSARANIIRRWTEGLEMLGKRAAQL